MVHSNSLFSTHQAKCHMGQVTMVTSCGWPSPGPNPMVPTAQCLKHTAYGQLALRQRGPGVGILQGNWHQGPQGLLASLLAPTALLQEARRAGRGAEAEQEEEGNSRQDCRPGRRGLQELISRHGDIYLHIRRFSTCKFNAKTTLDPASELPATLPKPCLLFSLQPQPLHTVCTW